VADSDDWRVTISVSPAPAGQSSSLRQAEEDIRRQVGRGIGVGAGEAQIFLYAGTEAAAGDARRIGRDVLAAGAAQWEVRVELGSHRQAVALARKLDGEGRAILRRWRYLYVGAGNEDEARELAGQIRQDAPPDAAVMVEQAGVGWPFPPS
jgi:hypothetical protein